MEITSALSIGCRNRAADDSVLMERMNIHTVIYIHTYACIAQVTEFRHDRAGTPELFTAVHCTDQDRSIHSFNCKCISAFQEGHSKALIISLSKLFYYLIRL